MTSAQLRSFRQTLLRWYDAHRRDLPWRGVRDPYRIWVSEIMLQQTRVAAVLDHYARFLRRFPTVASLASSREASVLAMWSGLGYYHRARRMRQAAKVIARERQGRFPQTAAEWAQLPGIGRYTAAAIASIGFGEAVAVVDGNVERVLQRLFAATLSRENAWQEAENLLDHNRPGDFNQAMMELGATVCTPRSPQCLLCPLNSICRSRGAADSKPQPRRKMKQVDYGLVQNNGRILLVRRALDIPLMPGMWELPMLSDAGIDGNAPLHRTRHSITDTDYRVTVYPVAAEKLRGMKGARWFSRAQYERLALTGLARKILRRINIALWVPDTALSCIDGHRRRI